VPASIKMQEQFGDDLQVVFVESQKASRPMADNFVLRRRWLGGRAMWTGERPVSVPGSSLPKCALLSSAGELLLQGDPLKLHGELEEAITAEIKRGKQAPDDLPRSLQKAWKEFAKGKAAKALAMASKIADAGGPDAEAAVGVYELFERRSEASLQRVEWLMDNGQYARADELAGELKKTFKGAEDLYAKASDLAKRLDGPELRSEREAEKLLVRLERKLYAEGDDAKLLKDLARFAEKHAGSRVGKRAQVLAGLGRPE
jgi:hypothetical protein